MPIQQPRSEKWQEIPEEEVWKAFIAGNHGALEHIYQAHVKELYNYGYQVLSDEVLVKEGIQEVFINLWRNKENLSRKVNTKYYLFKALRRQLVKYITQQKRVPVEHLSRVEEYAFWENDQEHQWIAAESSQNKDRQLNDAIAQLPERQREVVYLIFYKNLPYEEVADILSINLSSVYTLVWKAIRKLKKQLKYVDFYLLLLVSATLY